MSRRIEMGPGFVMPDPTREGKHALIIYDIAADVFRVFRDMTADGGEADEKPEGEIPPMTDSERKAEAHASLPTEIAAGQVWRHYKGGLYVIVAVSIMEDTMVPLVTYRSNKLGTTTTRTLANFMETVGYAANNPGGPCPRFRREED